MKAKEFPTLTIGEFRGFHGMNFNFSIDPIDPTSLHLEVSKYDVFSRKMKKFAEGDYGPRAIRALKQAIREENPHIIFPLGWHHRLSLSHSRMFGLCLVISTTPSARHEKSHSYVLRLNKKDELLNLLRQAHEAMLEMT